MPEQITITAYKYDELQGRAKEKASEKLREWATDHEWWDGVYDLAKEDGEQRGFEIDDIRFSGFWSQGDGASWTGYVKISTFLDWYMETYPEDPFHAQYIVLRELVRDDWIDAKVAVNRRGYHYVHSNTIDVGEALWDFLEDEVNDEDKRTETLKSEGVLKDANVAQLCDGINIAVTMDELNSDIKRCVKEFADEIYKRLEDEYESLVTDEAISEMADANDYRFDEYGDVV